MSPAFKAIALLVAHLATAQDIVQPIGPDISPPTIRRQVTPTYSREARLNGFQGTVVLQVVITETGHVTDVTVLSPVGYGLDENAQAAVEKWLYSPAKKDGRPVAVSLLIEVRFRSSSADFDQKDERQRSVFNVAMHALARKDATQQDVDAAVHRVQELAQAEYAPALHRLGRWQIAGDRVAKEPEAGLARIERAAAKGYGPALYDVASRRVAGQLTAEETEKALDQMRRAALLGSLSAQFYLANRYESGKDIPPEPNRAKHYFRLCASQGALLCQFRLGKLLLETPNRRERDYLQAIAWLQLAQERGSQDAKRLVTEEQPKLTPAQAEQVINLKQKLLPPSRP